MRSHAKVLFVVTALFMLFGVSPALAAKQVHSFFGNPKTESGSGGGQFSTPRGVAVNLNGSGGAGAGDLYVIDSSNNRVQRFGASGAFISAWGRDVDTAGGTDYEVCVTAANCKAAAAATGLGGELSSPQGIAINQATGDVYVTEQNGRRVQVFSATGAFLRTFGQDVVQTGQSGDAPAVAAKQSLKVEASAGTFKLTFRGQATTDLAFDAEASAVQAALQALSTVGAGNVIVSGGPGNEGGTTPYAITFAGALVNAPMPLIGAANGATPLSGAAATASVAHTTTGSTGYEICTAAANCKTGVSASGAGAFATTFSGHLAVAPTGAPNAGNVLVADPGNRRVQEFTAAGVFVRAFGYDVTASPPNSTTTFEACDAANFDVCKVGAASGSAVGQFGTNGPNRLAVDSTGAIYTVEQASPNFRVQRFTPAGPTLIPALFNPSISVTPAVNLSGTSTSDTPTDVAIGASDRVFVTKICTEANCPGAPLANERRIYEFTSTGVLQDTHNAGSAIGTANGLAANPSNGRLYLSSTNVGGQGFQRVYTLADATAPVATIAPVSGQTATTATLNGSVDPGGVLAGYHFEYVDDATFQATGWTNAQILPETDAGNAPSGVSRAIGGLAPGTLYHVRLLVKHSFGALSHASAEVTFMTGAAKPIVAPFADAEAATDAATLSSRVTANGQATSYHFEWGPTAGYGSSTPATGIGSGTASVFAAAEITGLQPNTTYHFRIVATSPAGTSEGADRVFTTEAATPAVCPNAQFRNGPGSALPNCRAYEQVSPLDKNGFDIQSQGQYAENNAEPMGAAGPASADGSAVSFTAMGPFADAAFGGAPTLGYRARRDADGWTTNALIPRISPAFRSYAIQAFSPDLGKSLLYANAALTGESSSHNFYLRDNSTRALAFRVGMDFVPNVGSVASRDLSHLAFDTKDVLTADPGQPGTSEAKVYESVDGELRLVSRQPGNNEPFPTEANLGQDDQIEEGVMSDDGAHIFFTAPTPRINTQAATIYRRSDGTTTAVASPSRRSPADPLGARRKSFVMATPDGNRVFFTSAELLTDDANTGPTRSGADLYRYDFEADRLIDISATPGGNGARVEGVVETSEAGDRVYYVALGQVVPGQGTAGEPNLYLWEDDGTARGTTRFIGTLDSTITIDPAYIGDRWNWTWSQYKRAQATADGSQLAFVSRAPLTGYDNHQAGSATSCSPSGSPQTASRCAQLYRYDADANGGAGELLCLSCDTGDLPTAAVAVVTQEAGFTQGRPRTIAEDGRRVFFTSPDSLLPADTNGKFDAYMWEADGAGSCQQAGGCISLLSSGTSDGDSYFHGASADGDDAFFRTRSQLVPQDGDTVADLYTAHVGGGFLSQQAIVPPSCAGEECRGDGTRPPSGPSPLTSSFSGPGNSPGKRATRCPKGKRKVKTRGGKTRCVKKKSRSSKNHNRTADKNGRASR